MFPWFYQGTSFNNGKTDLSVTEALANEIIEHLEAKDDLFIPQYEKSSSKCSHAIKLTLEKREDTVMNIN